MFEWAAHEDRMTNGLAGLRINFGRARVAELEAVCEKLVRDNGLVDGEAFLYLEVTRGTAPRVHHFPSADTQPTVFVNATKFVAPRELREKGGKAVSFPDMRWARCDWKTVNLVGSVLARQAAQEAGAYEAILHKNGVITEGAATNVFAVIDGTPRTHPLSPIILPGVPRKWGVPRTPGGAVEVPAWLDGSESSERLHVAVRNTGAPLYTGAVRDTGLPADLPAAALAKVDAQGAKVGVDNVRRRLAGHYAGRATLTLAAEPGRGTIAELIVPLVEAAGLDKDDHDAQAVAGRAGRR